MTPARFGWVPWWGKGPRPQTADGKRACRMCPNAVAPRRRDYCSAACADDYRIRTSGSHARWSVEKRDKGVCSECGLDTDRIERILERARSRARIGDGMRWSHEDPGSLVRAAARLVSMLERLKAAGFKVWISPARDWGTWSHLWEADHIVAVVEGGGACALDNLRTLCLRCHHKATADLAARRAKDRRRSKPLPLFVAPPLNPTG